MPTHANPPLAEKALSFLKQEANLGRSPLAEAAKTLLLTSDYACRQVEHVNALLQEDDACHTLASGDYHATLLSLPLEQPLAGFSRQLRAFRHRHLLCFWLRELAGMESTVNTLRAWSVCAEAMIARAIAFCAHQLQPRYGQPVGESGKIAQLLTIAMGKLGGRELNFSSDVDLIFAYSESGCTEGNESIDNGLYFTKLIQQLVQVLQTVTADGFVLRVDLRLRPNGDSGPLVLSLPAMETYYQEQGRDWERYAMVKARLLGESEHALQTVFYRIMNPFVYRRYADFSAIESLRGMKVMIEREVRLKPMLDDIKRGWGGIREIEFIVQCFQLIRGGRLPDIQAQNTLEALGKLKGQQVLAHTAALQHAYLFLRKLENALQIEQDRQTHQLPETPLDQARIARAMGYRDWKGLSAQLNQYRRIVTYVFKRVLGNPESVEEEQRLLVSQLTHVWQGAFEPERAIHLLLAVGIKEPERCYQMVHAFRASPRCRRLSQTARIRLDRFMMLLLEELVHQPEASSLLMSVLHLLEKIVGRSAYLALLIENPGVLRTLLDWFRRSSFLTDLFIHHPFLLDTLVNQPQSWCLPSRKILAQQLQEQLAYCYDLEQEGECLRQFKLVNWLVAACAELSQQVSAVRAGEYLADVAQVILDEVVQCACRDVSVKYPEMEQIKSQFIVVAYGKLGSREMSYDSDLDLVFLHTVSPEQEGIVLRLTQKILHWLTTRLPSGVLYSVDTRLRPSGSAGLLVSRLDAFVLYQKTQAWTWEHQALLRARILIGQTSVRQVLLQLKQEIIARPKALEVMRGEIQALRNKVDRQGTMDSIKYMPGGLLDLEFLVQFLILSGVDVSFARVTSTLAQIQQLFKTRVLSQAQFECLSQAYCHYHQLQHQHTLQSTPAPKHLQVADEILMLYRTFGFE